MLNKHGGGGRGWYGRLKGRVSLLNSGPNHSEKKASFETVYLPFPKIKNLTVMFTNIQENPKNCTRLYMNRYPFFKLVRAEKQRKAERC